MYTEIFVNVDLRSDTPPSVIDTLKAMCGDKSKEVALLGHPRRWGYLFFNGSYYTTHNSVASIATCNQGVTSLLGKGDIKNYDQEIEAFFNWIAPWVDGSDGDFIGYKRYEECQAPELVFLADVDGVLIAKFGG